MRKLGKILYISVTILVIAIVVAKFLWVPVTYVETSTEPEPTKEQVSVESTNNAWDMFIEAVIWQESRGLETAVGDNGQAVGVLQIHPIMVREANRILALTGDSRRYQYEDRLSRTKSIEIFNIVQDYHNREHDFELALRIWNRNHPDSYRTQIMRKYNELTEI